MKTLFILRHAKSSWENAAISDFERPLNESGINEAHSLAKTVLEMNFQPEIIVSSPAERAKQTAILIKENARLEAEIQYDERIYEASPHRLIEIIGEFEKEKKSAMLIGHNPGFEALIKILTAALQPMQTASLAVIDLDAEEWNKMISASGRLRMIIHPKDDLKPLNAI